MADRVQAPELRLANTRLTTTPIAGSTYVRPAQSSAGQDLSRIADALGSLNPAILNFAGTQLQERKRMQKEQAAGLAAMTPDEIRTRMQNGEFQDHASAVTAGSRLAEPLRDKLMEDIRSGAIKPTDNLDEIIAQRVAEASNGLNPMAKGALAATFAPYRGNITQMFQGVRLERKNQEDGEGIGARFGATIEALKKEGKNPNDIATELWKQHDSNVAAYPNIDPAKQREFLVAQAKAAARNGDVDLVKAIMENDRGGKGSLSKTSEYGPAFAEMVKMATLERARKVQAEDAPVIGQWEAERVQTGKASPKEIEIASEKWQFTPEKAAALQRIAENARIDAKERAAIELKRAEFLAKNTAEKNNYMVEYMQALFSGKPHTVLPKLIQNEKGTGNEELSPAWAAERYNSLIDEQVARGALTPQQATEKRLQLAINAGAKVPQFHDVLKAGAASATAFNFGDPSKGTDQEPMPQAAVDGFELYRRLASASASALLAQGVSTEAMKIYDLANTQLRLGIERDPSQALMEARRQLYASEEAKKAGKELTKLPSDDIITRAIRALGPEFKITDESVNEALNKNRQGIGYFLFGSIVGDRFGGAPERNLQELVPMIRDRVKMLVETQKIDANTAVRDSLKWLDSSHASVNGRLVRVPAGHTRDVFAESVEGILEDFAARNKDKLVLKRGSDYSIERVSEDGDTFIIIDRKTGLRPRNVPQEESVLTVEGVRRFQMEKAFKDRAAKERTNQFVGEVINSAKPTGQSGRGTLKRSVAPLETYDSNK